MKTIALITACAAILFGCTKERPEPGQPLVSDKAEGQVFYVTNSGDSVKLGGIKIVAVESSSAWKARHQMELEPLHSISAQDAWNQTLKGEPKGFAELASVGAAEVERIISSGVRVGEAITDADGRFKFMVRADRGRYVVAAVVRRSIRGEEAHLSWVLSHSDPFAQFMLTNETIHRPSPLSVSRPPSAAQPKTPPR